MIYLLIFFLEIILLFFLSINISKSIFRIFPIGILAFIFFPGVVIHELSHLFAATVLFVKVGEMEFVPKIIGSSLKLGSVQIAKTDPVRRSLIGFAPVFMGIVILVGIAYLFAENILALKNANPFVFGGIIMGIAYLLFVVSNTMFSSRKDMEGTFELLIALLIILVVLYIAGLRPDLEVAVKIFFQPQAIDFLQKLCIFLAVPVVVNLLILGVIKLKRF